jgi:hypothetical protein
MSSHAADLVLKAEPDWAGAAEVLIESCAYLPTPEDRVRWMERLCVSLGDALYPAFLQVLCRIGEHGNAQAQKTVADTLVLALQSGRMPSGRHAAWGAQWDPSKRATRTIGPIEYLCAWFAQPDGRGTLGAAPFDLAARSLIGLVSHSETARRLYCATLMSVAEDPLEGTWSRSSRQALQAMARGWASADSDPKRAGVQAVEAFLAATRLSQNEKSASGSASTGWIPPASWR